MERGVRRMEGKRRRRKSTNAAIYIPIAALLVIFLMVYGTSAFLKIIEIEVAGSTRYTGAEIIAAAGIARGENMLLVDTIDAQRRIYTELPFISEVKITRTMPDTIRIDVRESAPLASVAHRGAVAVLDYKGKVLRIAEAEQPGLIEVRGFRPADATAGSLLKAGEDDDSKLKYLIGILTAIDSAGLRDGITYIDIDNIAFISLDFNGRKVLLGGAEDDMKGKLEELPERIAEVEEISPDDKAGIFNMSRRPWRWEPER